MHNNSDIIIDTPNSSIEIQGESGSYRVQRNKLFDLEEKDLQLFWDVIEAYSKKIEQVFVFESCEDIETGDLIIRWYPKVEDHG